MDAFYASVEQRDFPELRGRPVVVGGAGTRGVVAAASYEAREFGVYSAMPSVEARRLCPELVFVRGDMKRYAMESRRIFDIFGRFSPAVEGLSLDEAFLDLTGTERLLGPAREVGERLRKEVREVTALPISVGIGPIKMVAKIASGAAKPDGLLEVRPAEVRAFLDPLSARKIWGVGPVAGERLEGFGYRTIGDLARADLETLRSHLGDWGVAIGRLARGVDLREVEPHREAVSLSEENTFEGDVSDRGLLEATILTHAEAVARRLRRQGLLARTVVLKWRLARRTRAGARGYPVRTRQLTLTEPTDDGEVVAQVARSLLTDALAEPVRLLGVGASGLVDEGGRAIQLGLFDDVADVKSAQTPRRRRELNRALDVLADRFGDDVVRRASQADARHATLSGQWKKGSRDTHGPEADQD
ncbi:MAG: DNA polymerase IV [Deltaproteobacteria bacterium]|nr:DNA polymerase IV [Deltaproteobacteria bacterium]